jgi:hypothetical protein
MIQAWAAKKKNGGLYLYTVAGSKKVAMARFIDNYTQTKMRDMRGLPLADIQARFDALPYGQTVTLIDIKER